MSHSDTAAPGEMLGHLDLSGTWRAGVADEELRRTWYTDAFDDREFVDITTPGHWRCHEAFAENDDALLYRRRFSMAPSPIGSRTWLHLDGVCSQGDVWLDGEYLGNTDGAWVPERFEVTDVLRARTEHLVGIEVASPPVGDPASKRGLLGTWQDGPYVKPGWNPGGIWRPVTIRRTGSVAITRHRVLCTSATPDRAVITVTCTLDSDTAGEVTIRTVAADVDHERRQPLAKGSNTVTWTVGIPNPDLWWPYELGAQPLTAVTVDVSTLRSAGSDGDRSEAISDRLTTSCGLRQVNLSDWILTVNGERLYVKGILAGPAAHELATAPTQVFTDQIAQVKAAGANTLRVHAHVSRDELYEAADRDGLLIWQDLPLYRGQHRSVRRTALRTAEAVVDRLGSHPGIVLWCGHDEPDHVTTASGSAGLGRRAFAHELPNWSRSVLDRSVKRALTALDPSRPVIGSSGTWPHPPSLAGTDTHVDLGWSAGEADDLDRLARIVPRAVRFVQITPSPSTTVPPGQDLQRAWPPDDLRELVGDSPIDDDVVARRLPPDGFDTAEDWHRATLNYQAELVRTQVEALRRLKYRPTGGFMVAHLSDLRAVMAPSLVDHLGMTKPAFDALRAACAPVLVTLDPWPHCAHPDELLIPAVYIVNDTRSPLHDARLDVDVRRSDSAADDQRPVHGEHWEFGGDIDADSVGMVGRIRVPVRDGTDRIDLRLQLFTTNLIAEARYTVPVHIH